MEYLLSNHTVLLDDDVAAEIAVSECRIAKVTNNRNLYVKARKEYLHRLVMGCTKGDGRIVDHINGNALDNRRENLRLVTPADNSRNANKRATPSQSKYKGVWVETRGNSTRFRAAIYPNGKAIRLGSFETEEAAAAAYDEAAIKFYGHHAKTNLAIYYSV